MTTVATGNRGQFLQSLLVAVHHASVCMIYTDQGKRSVLKVEETSVKIIKDNRIGAKFSLNQTMNILCYLMCYLYGHTGVERPLKINKILMVALTRQLLH